MPLRKALTMNASPTLSENPKVLREQFLDGKMNINESKPLKSKTQQKIPSKMSAKSKSPLIGIHSNAKRPHKLVTLNSLESALSTNPTCVEARMFNFTSKAVTQKGFIPDTSKVNQDRYFIKNITHKDEVYNIFGIFDGHGVNGHLVSDLAKKLLEAEITRLIYKNYIMDVSKIQGSFNKIHREISESKINSSLSGTTVLIVIIVKDVLIEINLGDSEYGLFSSVDNEFKFMWGNSLHNFSNPKELERVQSNKCVIKCLRG